MECSSGEPGKLGGKVEVVNWVDWVGVIKKTGCLFYYFWMVWAGK